ncbi:MAG: EF-hand domain-containing protein [Devosia sp.]
MIGAEELAGMLSGEDAPARASAILSKHDLDGDDKLTLAELTHGNLAPETLASLLSRQEYATADRAGRLADDRNAVDDFFARADIDGDGQLSKDEFDAERLLRMAQSLDAGEYAPQHMFGILPGAMEDDVIARGEIPIGRRLVDVATPVKLDEANMDPKLVERLKNLRHLSGEAETPGPPRPDTPTALGNAVRSAELTQTLIARLIQQLERGSSLAPTQDLMA